MFVILNRKGFDVSLINMSLAGRAIMCVRPRVANLPYPFNKSITLLTNPAPPNTPMKRNSQISVPGMANP